MKKDDLLDYGKYERSKARVQGPSAIKNGIVRDFKQVYQDIQLPTRYGLQRKGAPLDLLCLLYPATIVYVPPSTRESLERRFNLTLENFVALAEKGLIVPLIGHPEYYAELPHLDPVLNLKPPSVWERGNGLLELLGGEELFEEARQHLPLKKLTRLSSVRRNWAEHYHVTSPRDLTTKIELELCTLYIDLCIFGYRELALEIAAQPPAMIPQMLLSANEVATYPHLFGLGGTPNYGVQGETLLRATQLYRDTAFRKGRGVITPQALPENLLRQILDGFQVISPNKLSAEDVSHFHETGASTKLQHALAELEGILAAHHGADVIIDKAKIVSEALTDAQREIKKIAAWRPRAESATQTGLLWSLRTVGFSIGYFAFMATLQPTAVSPLPAILSGLGGSWVIFNWGKELMPVKRVQQWLVDLIAKRRFSPLAVNLWGAGDFKK